MKQEYGQEKSGFSFDSMKKVTKNFSRYQDIGASSYCNLPKSYCNQKFIVNIQPYG